MNDPIDFSDRIAWVQVCLEVLMKFEPDGEWNDHALLKKWRKSTYALTRKEFAALERVLDKEQKRVTAPKPVEYVQLSLFGDVPIHVK